MLDKQYTAWVHRFLLRYTPQGNCQFATSEMQKEFPELRRVRGYVTCVWGERTHWWLETSEGTVVDPTASQFPVIYHYAEYHEGDDVKIGRCLNCGMTIMGPPAEAPKTTCSPECYEAFALSLSL